MKNDHMNAGLRELLNVLWNTPADNGWSVPAVFYGPPGEAKTAIAYQEAKARGVPFLHLSPAQKGEGYFGVVPVLYDNGDGRKLIHFPVNEAIDKMCQHGVGLILLDELTSAPTIVKPALLGTLQERLFGDVQFPVGVRIWAAANPPDVAANGKRLAPPEANRLCHLDWPLPSAKDLLQYHGANARSGRIFPSREGYAFDYDDRHEKLVVENWAEQYGRASQEVWSFGNASPESHRNMPKPSDPKSGLAWPSTRSWTNASRLLAAGRTLGASDDTLQRLIAGCVGDGACDAFLSWLKNQDLPDYAAWLDGKVKVEWDDSRLDRTFAVMTGAASFVLSDRSKEAEKRARALWTHIGVVAQRIGAEGAIVAAKMLNEGGNPQADSKEAKQARERLFDYLKK